MKGITSFLLSIISGVLLAISWPNIGNVTICIFFAFVPLLYVIQHYKKKKWWLLFGCFLTFNALTTWWIYNSTVEGAFAAIIANSALMCLPIGLYSYAHKKYNKIVAGVEFVSGWMLFEYIHLNWQLSWPWLTLGNVFAGDINWIQWYEYTGVAGGSLWILCVNYLIFMALNEWTIKPSKAAQQLVLTFSTSVVIVGISYLIKSGKPTVVKHKKATVTIVQPNIDPYQKFGAISIGQQIEQLFKATGNVDSAANTIIIWPETALSDAVNQAQIQTHIPYTPIYSFLEKHPQTTLLTGLETYQFYGLQKQTATARKTNDGNYYDVFNAAGLLQHNKPTQLYNKSKLVPGVESLPTFLNFLAPVFEQFGGTTGGYGVSDSSLVFTSHHGVVMAPVICYESIYGNYVSSYIKRGANLITIITNDGWWGNTPGYHQHLAYGKLRAIETRKYVVRSANTGISAIINDKGNIEQQLDWNKQAAITAAVPLIEGETFYVRYGDYLYQFFSIVALGLIAWFTMHTFIRKK